MNGRLHCLELVAEGVAPTSSARTLAEIVTRLGSEFPTVDPDRIRVLLEASLGRTDGARVQNFRLVLAEREVRDRLRRGLMESVEIAREAPDQWVPESSATTRVDDNREDGHGGDD